MLTKCSIMKAFTCFIIDNYDVYDTYWMVCWFSLLCLKHFVRMNSTSRISYTIRAKHSVYSAHSVSVHNTKWFTRNIVNFAYILFQIPQEIYEI